MHNIHLEVKLPCDRDIVTNYTFYTSFSDALFEIMTLFEL